ncbi:hypothetical protein ACFE04_028140 [Oxalis oulophora]
MYPIKINIVILLLNLLIIPSSLAKQPHVINFRSPNLYPEAITWDPLNQHFIVGSLHHHSIHSISDSGIVQTLISDPTLPSNTSILGLAVDSVHRRLLAVIDKGALAAYDLTTHLRIFLSLLPIPDDNSNGGAANGMVAMANDVAVDFNGNAYVTSSVRNIIWKVGLDGEASIFSSAPVFQQYPSTTPGFDCGLNGIAYVNKGYLLVVQSNTGKMFKVDAEDGSGKVVPLTEELTLADDVAIRKDGVVLVVSQHSLWFLQSDDNWGQGVVFDKTTLNMDGFATSVVVVGEVENRAYVLYGHLNEGMMGNNSKENGRELFRIEEVRSAFEASGERLVSAARDGDLVEAKMLLDCNPCLAKYSTFGGLNSPLHFAAAKGHNEIVALLLQNGADVNSRNYCGQTALMQACRYGHWEVVQTLLLFRCNVIRADYLSGRTALHFAAVNGHVRCIRLVVSDFVPSAPFQLANGQGEGDRENGTHTKSKHDQSALSKFVNKAADGGITALHMAALNGYFDCVQLLLDLHANISGVTFHYGTSMDLIGAGSTPLHYAACGGNLKCCQVLLARGASRLTLNCNGWLPVDVARMWGRHWLEPLLGPNSESVIPRYPPSNYLSLPLLSILNIARESGMQSLAASDENDTCAVCLERTCSVAAAGCRHELCVRCALYLCSTCNIPSETVGPPGSIPCPFCRHGIVSFNKLPGSSPKEIKQSLSLGLCTPCVLHPRDAECQSPACAPDIRKNRVTSVSSEIFCPVTCGPFPSVAMPLCTCKDGSCPSFEPGDSESQDSSPRRSTSTDPDKIDARLEKTTCSSMFWGRRSCSREHQCNSEINI